MGKMDTHSIREEAETYARLTAVKHEKSTHFSVHERVEGYFENRDVPEFIGSDRLFRLDTMYGTIQMGYNPRRGQSFLFANIKASILDTAPSRYQKELKEYQQMNQLRQGTKNTAYSTKRRPASAVVLYNAEARPWSRYSISPYLRRTGMESLRKTMPFLDRSKDRQNRRALREEQKALERKLYLEMAQAEYKKMAETRAKAIALTARQNDINALIYRGEAQERLFFRKINGVYDLQKHAIFQYYRQSRFGGQSARSAEPINTPGKGDEDEDE